MQTYAVPTARQLCASALVADRSVTRTGLPSVAIAALAVAMSDLVLLLVSDQFAHWFLLPLSVCAVLVGIDAVDWLRCAIDLYDPAGIVGLLGLHYFYAAPLLHVYWDAWVVDSGPPGEWREWLGYMAILNAAGLILYRVCRRITLFRSGPAQVKWDINYDRFRIVLPVAILIAAAAQASVYARFGGVTGYMDSLRDDPNAWVGLGPLFMISESAPILITFFVVVRLRQRSVSWVWAFSGFVALFGLQMYFGGLRGSRSETVQLFFCALGCIHFFVRPVPRRLVFVGLGVLIVFLYFYAFYKAMGKEAGTAILASSEDRAYIARQKHKTGTELVLGDMARADIQAYILYRLQQYGREFDYAWGRTYLGSLEILIPRMILPKRVDTKLKEGTEIQYGSGGYDESSPSSHVYGMPGECMLNFGPLGAPLAYAVFGLIIGTFRKQVSRLAPGDARFLWVPLGVYMCLGFLLGDSDNEVFGLAKNGFMPLLVVTLCSTRVRPGALWRMGRT